MEEVENERQLLDNLQKCRCCFRMLIDDRKAVQIDENIRNQFFSLTQIEVKLIFPKIHIFWLNIVSFSAYIF